MKVYNIGFRNAFNEQDETQIDIAETNSEQEKIDFVNIILELRDEMQIKEIIYIDKIAEEDM